MVEESKAPSFTIRSMFAADSTFLLMKKFMIYKFMGSNFFMNHSFGMLDSCYRLLGVKTTNRMFNSTMGVFTSGETLQTLMKEVQIWNKLNINVMAGYVVEGIKDNDDKAKIQMYFEYMMKSIEMVT